MLHMKTVICAMVLLNSVLEWLGDYALSLRRKGQAYKGEFRFDLEWIVWPFESETTVEWSSNDDIKRLPRMFT